jgi:hypothetical protein
VEVTKPGKCLSKVDLPEPEAPNKATISPSAILIDTLSNAKQLAKDFVSSRVSTA